MNTEESSEKNSIVEAWRDRGELESLGGLDCFVIDRPGDETRAPVLWLHGFPSSSLDWHRVIDRAGRRRMLLIDLPGFGFSAKPRAGYSYSLVDQADRVLMMLIRRGIDRIALVAHDMGTSLACELLARREAGLLPVAIESLVLTNGSVYIDQARLTPSQKLLRSPLARFYTRVASWWLFHWQIGKITGPAIPESELAAMWALMRCNDGINALLPTIGYIDERYRFYHRWTGPLERLDIPTLVLWGRRDPVAVAAIGQRLADAIPGARLTWLEKLGHFPMLEDPDSFANAITAFIDPARDPTDRHR